jgi:hypothetical protein
MGWTDPAHLELGHHWQANGKIAVAELVRILARADVRATLRRLDLKWVIAYKDLEGVLRGCQWSTDGMEAAPHRALKAGCVLMLAFTS